MKLELKYLENEGVIPYCESCKKFCFALFNVAISTIVYEPKGEKIVLIQQYRKDKNILIADYVNKGENAVQNIYMSFQNKNGELFLEFPVKICQNKVSSSSSKSRSLISYNPRLCCRP